MTWWNTLENDTLIETAWERQMNISGMETYEDTRDPKRATDTVAGKKYLRKLIDKADAAILTMQKELIAERRVERNLKGTVLLVPSDTTAMLTVKLMIDRTYSAADPMVGASYHKMANELARSVELELNFRYWVQQSREVARAYAKEEGLARVPRSMAERLIEDHGVTKRTLNRWRQSFTDLSEYKWDTLEQHYCGDALLCAAAKGLTDYFEVHYQTTSGSNQKFVRMKPGFRKDFDDLEFTVANMQRTKKPMITRPRKWTKDDE